MPCPLQSNAAGGRRSTACRTLLETVPHCPRIAEQLEPLLLAITSRLDRAVIVAKQGDRRRSLFLLFNLMVFLEKAIALSRKEDS